MKSDKDAITQALSGTSQGLFGSVREALVSKGGNPELSDTPNISTKLLRILQIKTVRLPRFLGQFRTKVVALEKPGMGFLRGFPHV